MRQSLNLEHWSTRSDTAGIRPAVHTTVLRNHLGRDEFPLIRPLTDESTSLETRHARTGRVDPEADRESAATITANAAFAALERLNLAVVLLRSDCHVLFTNSAAQRIAARRDCYMVNALRLQLVDQRSHRAFVAFLYTRPRLATGTAAPYCVSCRDGLGLRYFLFAEWLANALPGTRSAVSLFIYEPHLAGQLSHELLAHLYGLTRMESQLVCALFVKPNLRTAAALGGISLNTAKTHLKHVFAKCGVRSKAELLRLLALGPQSL